MNITKNVNGDELLINMDGRLDTSTAADFENFINENLANASRVTLNCENLAYISSAGLRVLLATHKKMNGAMKLTNVGELVAEIFEMTGFSDILVIE